MKNKLELFASADRRVLRVEFDQEPSYRFIGSYTAGSNDSRQGLLKVLAKEYHPYCVSLSNELNL